MLTQNRSGTRLRLLPRRLCVGLQYDLLLYKFIVTELLHIRK